jgi:hypothetical protein
MDRPALLESFGEMWMFGTDLPVEATMCLQSHNQNSLKFAIVCFVLAGHRGLHRIAPIGCGDIGCIGVLQSRWVEWTVVLEHVYTECPLEHNPFAVHARAKKEKLEVELPDQVGRCTLLQRYGAHNKAQHLHSKV